MSNADRDEPKGGSADPEDKVQAKATTSVPPVSDTPTIQYKRHILQSRDNPWRTRITKIAVTKTTQTKPSEEACLVLIYPPGSDLGKRFPLTQGDIVLGRGRDCTILVDRDSVSRRHARISYQGKGWFIEDLQSTNGSYVNDVPIKKLPLRDSDFVKIGAAIFKFFVGTDVEASYHEEIYNLTIVDALTGTYNKRYFQECLDRELTRSARFGRPLSLVLFDIDHLKQINDKHGHLTGDYVLRELSRRLIGSVRKEEVLARHGGEEFAVVLPERDLAGARAYAEQLRRVVSDQPYEYEGETFQVTISLGVACVSGEDLDAAALIKLAEDNLQRAKHAGRNRVVAGAEVSKQWDAAPAFRAALTDKMAIAALSLLGRDQGRDQLPAGADASAVAVELEGLLYSRLREHERPDQRLAFGVIEGGAGEGGAGEGASGGGGGGRKLLVALEGPTPVQRLRAILSEALRGCAEQRLEARFAVGPIALAHDSAGAVEAAVAGLDAELGALEGGHHLPHPVAVALRAIEGVTPARAQLVLDLGETLLQWLALCAAAELEAAGRPAADLPPLRWRRAGDDALPTIEGWLELLIAAVEEILGASTAHHAVWRASFGDRSTREQVLGWLRSFADLQGAFAQGAAGRDEHVARKLVDEAAPRLRQLIRRELRPVLALVPAELELVGFEGELVSYRMTRLTGGAAAPPVPLYSRKRMNPGLWLCDASADRAIPLEPFCVRDTCPKCGGRELFLLSRLDELELRAPASGHELGKPAAALPLSAEARERLLALLEPPSAGGPAAPPP